MHSKGPINNFVCRNLRQIRIARGIKVLEVARKTNIPPSSYSCLEWGRYKLNLDNLFRILHAINASINDVWPKAGRRSSETVTTDEIERILERSQELMPPQVSVDEFVKAICDVCHVERIDRAVARSSKRIREVQVFASIIVRDIPQITLTRLSHRLDVNISSLSHRTRRLLHQAATDRKLAKRIEETRKAVLNRLPQIVLAQAS